MSSINHVTGDPGATVRYRVPACSRCGRTFEFRGKLTHKISGDGAWGRCHECGKINITQETVVPGTDSEVVR